MNVAVDGARSIAGGPAASAYAATITPGFSTKPVSPALGAVPRLAPQVIALALFALMKQETFCNAAVDVFAANLQRQPTSASVAPREPAATLKVDVVPPPATVKEESPLGPATATTPPTVSRSAVEFVRSEPRRSRYR